MMNRNDNLVIENAHILFRNLEGRPDKYNLRGGNRSFCVILDDPEVVQRLTDEGWNVRILAARDEDEEPRHYLQVAVSYAHIPPKVYLVTRKKRELLTEDTVAVLDHADIANVDLSISPYRWQVNGSSGVKAYLKTMYVTVEEDELAEKYENYGMSDASDEDVPF